VQDDASLRSAGSDGAPRAVDSGLLARPCIEPALRSPSLLLVRNLARPATFEFAERDRRSERDTFAAMGQKVEEHEARAARVSHANDRQRSAGRIRVGTSGWSYRSWRGPFFPTRLAAKHHLEYYASQFHRGTECRLLSDTHSRSRRRLARSNRTRLCFCLESVEIYHPLEALIAKLGEQPCASRRAIVDSGR